MHLLTGEPLALDLVNTRFCLPSHVAHDALATAQGLDAWLAKQAGRLTPPDVSPGPDDLAAVRDLRGHVERALEAARQATPPPPEAIAELNHALRAAPAYPCLDVRGAVLRRGTARDGTPLDRLLAELAEAAVALLTDPDVGKVRGCEGPGCRLLFLPAHPRRRWCSPDLCGNRVRVARYYRRRK
ncbi:zf-CGNR multi-domain protein [Nonomuraea mesophila]|uniref:Zf-CGNR multi-domain protein n=1 Tax=Nonomuraea mesophila TaxID=2530382 RepID=A0A4R5F5L5_9ACTN|nr:CGNR zinc finger domain-containing protein [Nonomuraea mesophila]TDE42591.1 zf-CGNR multi-domain protein [Nonomuraea mesophila]